MNKDCTNCHWFWQNNDTENQCNGGYMYHPCHEFVEMKVKTINKQKAKEVLEKLFSDSTGEDYPFTEEFAEAVRIAIQVLEQSHKDCSECSRRKFYQQGYEDGYRDGLQ